MIHSLLLRYNARVNRGIIMREVTQLPEPKSYAPKAGELLERINDLIAEYDGEMSTMEAVGVLAAIQIKILVE